jgi:hypothetical protein
VAGLLHFGSVDALKAQPRIAYAKGIPISGIGPALHTASTGLKEKPGGGGKE